MRKALLSLPLLAAASLPAQIDTATNEFIQWETPHVHPLDLTPDGSKLLAVNTADGRLEVFDMVTGIPVPMGSIAVGVDPVTVRAVNDDVACVVNFVSDSISLVDINNLTLLDTVVTPDEPSDVILLNTSGQVGVGEAWVSCAEPNQIAIYDLSNLLAPPQILQITGEDPKNMAVSPNGDKIYVALQISGNNSTILNGASGLAPNIVNATSGPHGGQNPPFNAPGGFNPPANPNNPPPPEVSMIVKKQGGQWLDDTGADWTSFVSGSQAAQFGRIQGWDMYDHEVAIIDTATQAITYSKGTMNHVMGIAVAPNATGHNITIVGVDHTNEIRFEPNLKGTFVRVMGALIDSNNGNTLGFVDLNQHLAPYTNQQVPQATRDLSLGDPRALVWDSSGTFGWVAGMGSDNVALIDAGGGRLATIEVGSGPTGIVLDETRLQLYVLNKFTGSISVVDAAASVAIAEVPFHDPTPLSVKNGREFLYGTHSTSGLGQASCASCHFNGTEDGLAWDLGNPAGDMKTVHALNMDYNNLPGLIIPEVAEFFHPMKGPMATQTLQDIIGKEPFHWRGDRKGIEEFTGAFTGLLGDDERPTAAQMQQFEDLLSTFYFPPNPYRIKTNDLDTAMDLSRWNLHFTPQAGGTSIPLTTGNAQRGLDLFMPTLGQLQDGAHCVTCHTNPTGKGPDVAWDGSAWQQLAVGAHGEHHCMPVNADPDTQVPDQIPQLRNMHEKQGFDLKTQMNTRGFGFTRDGIVPTMGDFISEPVFTHTPGSEFQDVADLTAFMLSYGGTGLPQGDPNVFLNPPGPPARNTHAGVGFQWTVKTAAPLSQLDVDVLVAMLNVELASPQDIALIIKQNTPSGGQNGFYYLGGLQVQTDRQAVQTDLIALLLTILPGSEATFTLVPRGSEVRLGVDRDGDGWFDGDELALGSSPSNPRSVPPNGAACTVAAPSAPSGVSGNPGVHQVAVNWTDTSSNETGFAIERALTNSPQWRLVGTAGPNSGLFVDDTVAPSKSYQYRVRAFNCAGDSSMAVSGAITTQPLPNPTVCHVHAIDLQVDLDTTVQPNTLAMYGTVNVVDDQGRVVQGATVTVSITGSTAAINTTAVSNDLGQARFDTVPIGGGPIPTWTLNVLNISGTGFAYDPSANFETSKTIP